jgi:thiamine-monophosphate kinase
MNMTPSHITISIALSNRFSVEALTELYSGIKKACDLYRVDLIGGDTTSNIKGLAISVTAVGMTDNPNHITYRSGAKVGDILCISGDVGAAYLGLQLLEREKQLYLQDNNLQPDFGGYQYVIERQLKPEACKETIEYFRKVNLIPTSMIDVSDGLSSDLMHICKQSGVGAFLEEAKIPIHAEAKKLALEFNLDPVTCALNGGEDYELLFSIRPEDIDKIRFMPGAYIIGEIVPKDEGITLHTTGGNIHELKAQGWNHF